MDVAHINPHFRPMTAWCEIDKIAYDFIGLLQQCQYNQYGSHRSCFRRYFKQGGYELYHREDRRQGGFRRTEVQYERSRKEKGAIASLHNGLVANCCVSDDDMLCVWRGVEKCGGV